MLTVACCEMLSVAVPSVCPVERSVNVTVPVGLVPPALPETVAVNVTASPKLLGFFDDVTVVVLAAGMMFIPAEPLL